MVMSFENLWTIKFFKFIQLSDKRFLNIITRTCLGSCLVGLYFVLFYYLFTFYWILVKSFFARDIWDKVLKNGPSQTCGEQPLKNFTWSIIEYFVPFITQLVIYNGKRCRIFFVCMYIYYVYLQIAISIVHVLDIKPGVTIKMKDEDCLSLMLGKLNPQTVWLIWCVTLHIENLF